MEKVSFNTPPRRKEGGVKKIPTGIKGFDELLQGGIPKGRATLITGSTGTDKTVLLNEFLYKGNMRSEIPRVSCFPYTLRVRKERAFRRITLITFLILSFSTRVGDWVWDWALPGEWLRRMEGAFRWRADRIKEQQ